MPRRIVLLLCLCLALAAALAAGRPGSARTGTAWVSRPAGEPAGVPVPGMDPGRRLDHLLQRATFGLTVEERARAARMGSEAWLQEQLHPPEVEPDLERRLRVYPHYRRTPREVLQHQYEHDYALTASGEREVDAVPVLEQLMERQLLSATVSRYQLREMLVDFWFNHFNVFWGKGGPVQWALPEYVEGVIRPRALGRFRDLLGEVARSPAMLVYLDNWLSSATSEGGLNENYARELLELHTVGVEAGYSQRDVREVARCLSGWGLRGEGSGPVDSQPLRFDFDAPRHDPRAKSVMGALRLQGGGIEEGERVLDFLASHPATARRVCSKLARRFVADDPPPALVERAADTWLRTDGDLARVMEVLLAAPEFWDPGCFRGKVKTPLELAVSTYRVLDLEPGPGAVGPLSTFRFPGVSPAPALERLGAPLFQCLLPIGYPDRSEAWDHPGSQHARLEFAATMAEARGEDLLVRWGPEITPETLAARILPGGAEGGTMAAAREAWAASATPGEAASRVLAVLLASPEFRAR